MADCDAPPTATLSQTITQTRDQVLTTFSVVQDLSGTLSVQTLTTCAGSAVSGTGCTKLQTVTRTATVDQLVTHQVPFTQTVHDTVTITQPTKTLFGTCKQTHSSLTTPSPTVIETPITATDDQGSTYLSTFTTTTTPSPTYVPDPTGTPTQTAETPLVTPKQENKNIGPIVGGVVGGVVLLALIGALVWLWWRRRRQWDDIFDDNDEVLNDRAPGAMTQIKGDGRRVDFDGPAAYEYGVVGSRAPEQHITHSSYSGISPNHSPQPSQSSALPSDPRYTMSLPPIHHPALFPAVSPPPTLTSHSRNSSILPDTAHSRTSSMRPSTAQSSRPSSPAHMRRRSRGADEVIAMVSLTPREMSPPQPPATQLPNITPITPTTLATTAATTTTRVVTGPNEKRPRVVMSATPPVVVHTDGGRAEAASPQPQASGSSATLGEPGPGDGEDAPPAYS